jgi:hypothetical protein
MTDAFDPELARSAVALILEGQEPPFEGRVGARMDEAHWFDSADGMIAAGVDYFGPVARKTRRPRPASKKDVADTTNVVWLDLDPQPDAAADDSEQLVAEARRWLGAMGALDLGPLTSTGPAACETWPRCHANHASAWNRGSIALGVAHVRQCS